MGILKRILKVVALVVVLVGLGGGTFVYIECSKFDASMDKVYDVPVPNLTRSTDPAVLARGDHLVHSIAGCAIRDCHGADLAGSAKPTDIGPVGSFFAPNITGAGLGAAYTDGELARIIRHGLKKDGRSVRMMPSEEIAWLPDSDVLAIVSYIRTVPNVDRPNEPTIVKTLGKVLDRQEQFPWDVARRIDHAKVWNPPAPEPTTNYGSYVARLCSGCHGEHFSGGPIPGAPSTLPVPLNLTPHPSGLKEWSFADFDKLMRTGVRKNGKQLDPFMPVESWKNFDDNEMHATYAYLQSLPPTPFGQR
jgi:hypothetical protein